MRFLVFLLLLASSAAYAAEGLTPKSPEIVRAVERASAYLKANGQSEQRLGGKALIALALYKAGADVNEPFIQGTISEIQKAITSDGTVNISDHIYTAGLIILFLSEIDQERYRRELTAVGKYLVKNQRADGAWTYLTSGTADAYPSGDMSMTQYAVMALWTLYQLGYEIPGECIDRISYWLLSVQTPEGAYAYQTTVSDGFKHVSWNGPKLSMSAAGMASVYVCRDLVGFNGSNRKVDEIHEAFKEKSDDFDSSPLGSYRITVRKEQFNGVQMKGNAWMERNFTPVTLSTDYFFYYLYALERYAAFKELAENKFLESPPWYNKPAALLLEKQASDGSWAGNIGRPIDTAYAVLFLCRSTRRSFEKWKQPNIFDGGNMLGGRGLPKSTDEIKVEDGKVISLSEMQSSERLMDRLGDLKDVDEDSLARLAELPAEDIEILLQKNKTKIKKMVGHEKAEQRLAAVQMLGKSGDLSMVPALIYALTDPDPAIAEAAQTSLLRLARNSKRIHLPKPNDPQFERQLSKIIDRWKEWYRTIDPDAVFEDR